MKKPNRNKSISSVASTTVASNPISGTTDLELFSSYSHEQVHIYDKLCSSISSICQIAYCTSEGIHICVPQTYQRQSSSSSQNISSSLSSMLITRIAYPFESTDQTNTLSLNSSSYLFFEKIKTKYLPTLYQAYKLRPSSLSSFDRLLSSDTIQYKGFRQCLFSPFDIKLNQGESFLTAITCAHEVFIYEIISSSKRFYLSQSSNLKYDLTKILYEKNFLEKYFQDSDEEENYRLLYIHLTSNILWDKKGIYFFQLQYSGHLIIWKFNGIKILNDQPLIIIDTKISKALLMKWNEENEILLIIGKENQRILIKIDGMKVFNLNNEHENDYMNVEHAELIKFNEQILLLIESKINYCLIYSINFDEKTSLYQSNQIDYRLLPSPIVGIQQQNSNHLSIIIGCEDGTIHNLKISEEFPINILHIKQIANGQIKSCLRKPLLLRHFNLSYNELLLARIFYSPIVAPNVKFGYVLCTLHRWISTDNLDKIIENFLSRINIPLWCSSDELAVILNEITRGTTHQYQIKKNTNENFLFLQRLCRLNKLLNNTKQLQIFENQLLQNYRQQLSNIFKKLFSKMLNKLSQIELLIYTISCKDEQINSSSLLLCPMCNTSLNLITNDLLFSTCSNKHIWPRCSRTLLPLTYECAQTCSLCDRTITLIEIDCSESSCSFICLNRTTTLTKPPPIYINDSINDILLFFTINCTNNDSLTYANLSISIENSRSIEIKNSLPLDLLLFNNQTEDLIFNLTIHGTLLGYSQLLLHVEYLNKTKYIFNYTNDLNIDLAVKRKSTILDIIFTVIVVILVCIGTFLIGCRLATQNLYANIRRPIPILIGLFSQFLCLPLLAYGLAKLAKLDSSTAIGLLSTGSAPGGGASNMYTAMYGGDVDLSATMTFSSTILAFGTFPLWILLLGREYIDTHNVHFPWENMFATLFSLIIPASIGLLLRWKKPRIADRFTRYLRFITLFFIVYILTFGIYTNLYIFKIINYRTFLVSAALPYSGFLIGFLMSLITRQSRERAIAIFIESGLQNTGVAIFFLRLSLPQPDSDLAIVVPIFVAIAIPIPLLIIYAIISIYRRHKNRHGENTLVTNINGERDKADYEQLPTSDNEG